MARWVGGVVADDACDVGGEPGETDLLAYRERTERGRTGPVRVSGFRIDARRVGLACRGQSDAVGSLTELVAAKGSVSGQPGRDRRVAKVEIVLAELAVDEAAEVPQELSGQ